MLLWRGIEICVTLSPWPAVKNQVTGSFILNPKGKEATSRTFTAMGLEWEYVVEFGEAKQNILINFQNHPGKPWKYRIFGKSFRPRRLKE